MTISYWTKGLDPHHLTLPPPTREKMLRYTIYDCFTTTYLARPVLRVWTFQKVKNTHIIDLFQALSSTSTSLFLCSHENDNIINANINPQIFKNVIDNDLEFISEDSDDDIPINQCRTIPVNNALYEQISDDENCNSQIVGSVKNTTSTIEDISDGDNDKEKFVNRCTRTISNDETLLEPVSNDEQSTIISSDVYTQEINIQPVTEMDVQSEEQQRPPLIVLHRSCHHRRTATAWRHRHKKRNAIHRSNRYRYYVTRPHLPSFLHGFKKKYPQATQHSIHSHQNSTFIINHRT
ncbi:unnamed protein product [Rotaria magnacalcarata]|nr:unnamed protein product [Rotaria magnacalcarata]CAF1632994.1 unnamed protein product [Rotaria magnacalcarata]CAF4040577.1 unnamed protein product [Rotaria magnacalcarata]CAF4154860.1 unnamed protein product [Rotaria magnacalcarata]CAF4357691.1 unnamed protein product [Rotaria magnacalcarata]